jgi:D-aminoacyl-tRNA deacylase
MRVLLQRVKNASVEINNKPYSSIQQGLLIFLGIHHDDSIEDVDWLIKKILQLRIFSDVNAKMNLSIKDIEGSILVVSQFTLYASTKKGTRPSFTESAPPALALTLYNQFIKDLQQTNISVATGDFGADMQVSLCNDGPVTIWLDSKLK